MMDDFQALRISIASPQQILAWSRGEVKKPETINYRTHRAEVDGLMDERIFGPSKNYECYCGKYKKIRYRGIVCDQCGVEITTKRVRRERMGHIKLACPVTHVWFAYGIPNKLSYILNIQQKKLETVIYYARYLVTEYSEEGKKEALEIIEKKYDTSKEELKEDLKQALEEEKEEFKDRIKEEKKKKKKAKKKIKLTIDNLKAKEKKELAKIRSIYKQKQTNTKKKLDTLKELVSNLREGTTLSEEEYIQLVEYDIDFFDLGMGAQAIRKLLNKLDLDKLIDEINAAYRKTRSKAKKGKLIQRLRIIKGMKKANIDPAWLVLDVVPVLPPDLRPIIQLPGGRFATSDLNDLYRRVINRNNRLKRLMRLGAPEIILRNEKRMLQEAVDALIDNSHRPGNAVLNSRNQAYKSLSDMLRGKQGRFRQNLLGKRVDYSGRSVIISGPDLNIYECGIPKTMALELFKPFVLSEIIKEGLALNIKSAKLFYDAKGPEVWDILERVTKKHPVLLNRAPTLHKQGIQAFFPVLIEGDAIQIHPMICKGFNADFDGDQMAVHVPLTKDAKQEVLKRMMVDSNILLMADGTSVVNTEKDMALGVYYLTSIDEPTDEPMKYFSNSLEAQGMYDLEELKLHERIKVLVNGELIETSVGRLIFNDVFPEGFRYVNEQLDKKKVARLSEEILDKYGSEQVVKFLDQVKTLGFKFATRSGISVSFNDFVVSKQKDRILDEVSSKEDQYTEDYYMGLLAPEEKKRLVEEAWMEAIDKIAEITWEKYNEKENNLVMLNESGATPVANPLRQISGVKGLILDPEGKIVELPLRSNYKEGLSTLEYFVAARGTRKGLADTALKTAESGYLTRRLVDVAQDVITRIEDCGVEDGIIVERDANRRLSFGRRLHGRYLTQDVVDEETGEVVLKAGECVGIEDSEKINENENIKKAYVRSPLKCKALRSVCQKCYGYSLGTGKLVDKGIAVGIIAAQSMGEAATQLTLDTKHLAGRAGTDITQGLPRVEELFEARTPKGKAELSPVNGKVKIMSEETKRNKIEVIISNKDKVVKKYKMMDGDKATFKRSKKVKKGDLMVTRKDGKEIKAPEAGRLTFDDDGNIVLETKNTISESVSVEKDAVFLVKDGDEVEKGQRLTEGSIDPKELMEYVDLEAAQHYIIDNIQETYGVQGIGIDDRHVEVVVRQMSRFARIRRAGESEYLPNEYVDALEIERINDGLKEEDKDIITSNRELLGITTAAVRTESFLSAASFQEQVRVLTDASLIGKIDELRGLKENVIIGKPVPLGDELQDEG